MRKFIIKNDTLYGPKDFMVSITETNYPILLDLMNKQLDLYDTAKEFIDLYLDGQIRPQTITKLQKAVQVIDLDENEKDEEDD